MSKLVKGIFLAECKGRFACEVSIDGKLEKCYVASSAKLNNFIDLHNMNVLLIENQNKSKTKYSLFALEKEDKIILLNLNKVNGILINYLMTIGMKAELFKNEITFLNSFKADVVYFDSPLIIYEVKTILARENRAVYPCMQTKRVKIQLEKIIALLNLGYKIEYVFFLLEPDIIHVEISEREEELRRLFAEAIKLKMNIKVFKTLWNGNEFYIVEDNSIKKELLKNLETSI